MPREEQELAERKAALEKELAGLVTFGLTKEQHLQQVSSVAIKLGFDSYFGWIRHAGQRADDLFEVHFVTGNTGYLSCWPQWAFDQAKSALLYSKEVWILSNGRPFGDNLFWVLILDDRPE